MVTTNTNNRPVAVVTGASSGIGFELAKQFAEHGYDLILSSGSSPLDSAESAVRSFGANVLDKVTSDLSTDEGVHELLSRIKSTGRPVEALALNAGYGVGGDFARQTDLHAELKMIRLNVIATVHLAKHLLPDMIARKSGKVLITASIAAVTPGPYEAIYAATKAFDKSFAESLRAELQDTGVTVTALMPGPTDTNFFHRAGMDDTKVGAGKKDDPAQVARQGFEALMSDKGHIIAGSMKTKLEGNLMENVLPQSTKASLHVGMAKPGSANQ